MRLKENEKRMDAWHVWKYADSYNKHVSRAAYVKIVNSIKRRRQIEPLHDSVSYSNVSIYVPKQMLCNGVASTDHQSWVHELF
jgi:hypothetical protein